MNFEANRRKMLEDLKKRREGKKVTPAKSSSDYMAAGQNLKHEKEHIVIFGQKSPFIINLAASLGQSCKVDVLSDKNVDNAINFIVEHSIHFVIIDIDPPSDYHQAANFLTVVKTLSADSSVFVCTKDKTDAHSRTLSSHGGIIIGKPVSIPELMGHINGIEDPENR